MGRAIFSLMIYLVSASEGTRTKHRYKDKVGFSSPSVNAATINKQWAAEHAMRHKGRIAIVSKTSQ